MRACSFETKYKRPIQIYSTFKAIANAWNIEWKLYTSQIQARNSWEKYVNYLSSGKKSNHARSRQLHVPL